MTASVRRAESSSKNKVSQLSANVVSVIKEQTAPSPYQCACTLVKEGKAVACPTHWLASHLAEARH